MSSHYLKFLFYFLFLAAPILAERVTIEPNARTFSSEVAKKERIDIFDFDGEYPELENIEIDARRKKNVEFYLTGNYPELHTLNYEGTFGVLTGILTGMFPQLSLVNFLCTSCAMQLDLRSTWEQSCTINIRGIDKDITLNVPKNVGLIIHTKTGIKGKVIVCDELKKKGWFKILNKTYENPLAKSASVVLTINIETTDGNIILN